MASGIVTEVVSLPSEVTSTSFEVVSITQPYTPRGQPEFHVLSPTESSKTNDIWAEAIAISKGYDVTEVDPEQEPLVAVIGCGYVGTNLIGEFSSHYDVLGFDVSPSQIEVVRKTHGGEGSRASFTVRPQDLTKATHFLVSVPTLLKADKSIDTSYIRNALSLIYRYARRGSTIVIESSVAVGMTRELLGPLAKERGFFAGMSPERVDPGRTEPPMHTIPKVLSGLDDITPGSLAAITRLYSQVFGTIIPVSKPEVAEMMKLYENCQRMMCIAYANEMADACVPHGIDPYEVCKAAASKPFGYMPFTPSLGVGGHCIPVNPYYLLSNSDFPLLKAATEKMWERPEQIGQRALESVFSTWQKREHVDSRPSLTHIDSSIDVSFSHVEPAALATELNKLTHENPPRRFSQFTTPCSSSPSVSGSSKSSISSSEPNSPLDGESCRTSVSSTTTIATRPRVLVAGVGFKPGQSVLSNSPGQKLVQYLANSNRVDVMFADPLVKQSAIPEIPRLDDSSWDKMTLETFDMIIVTIKQTGLAFSILNELKGVKVQTWFP